MEQTTNFIVDLEKCAIGGIVLRLQLPLDAVVKIVFDCERLIEQGLDSFEIGAATELLVNNQQPFYWVEGKFIQEFLIAEFALTPGLGQGCLRSDEVLLIALQDRFIFGLCITCIL